MIRSRGTMFYSLLYFNSRRGYVRLKYLYTVISVKMDSIPVNTKNRESTRSWTARVRFLASWAGPGPTRTPFQRLYRKLQQFGVKSWQGECNKWDSKGNLWSFVFDFMLGNNWEDLSPCPMRPGPHPHLSHRNYISISLSVFQTLTPQYDSRSLSHLGHLYPGTTPVIIKLDYNRSCPWV